MGKITKRLPGIYVRGVWATLLLSGVKTIETRTRSIPKAWIGKELWVIQTGDCPARVVGIIKFSQCKKYTSSKEFYADSTKHMVLKNSAEYKWKWEDEKEKYGWVVESVRPISPIECKDIPGIKHMPGGVWEPFEVPKAKYV